MPGLNGTGPMGMGPMTGGARGFCNPSSRPLARRGFRQWFGWGPGRGRGYRHMYWATGQPGWMRFGPAAPSVYPLTPAYTREQEVGFLKDQAVALKEELEAIESRLRDLESEDQTTN
jgi:hypothetical protein